MQQKVQTIAPVLGIDTREYYYHADKHISRTTLVAKRLFDIVGASVGLILFSPILLVLALVVKFSSKGPILFQHDRVGKDGKIFSFFKFRSMYVDADKYARSPEKSEDPRITPIGRFLRKTSLDELPQLWLVLKGDMSLVGPRPEMPNVVANYTPEQKLRLRVKPGITGVWQISPDRIHPIHENIGHDLYYIDNISLGLDIALILETAFKAYRGKNTA